MMESVMKLTEEQARVLLNRFLEKIASGGCRTAVHRCSIIKFTIDHLPVFNTRMFTMRIGLGLI